MPSGDPHDLREQDLLRMKASLLSHARNDQEMAMVCYQIAKYLPQKPNNTVPASETCKYIYSLLPYARDVIAKYGSCAKVPIIAFGQGYSTRNL